MQIVYGTCIQVAWKKKKETHGKLLCKIDKNIPENYAKHKKEEGRLTLVYKHVIVKLQNE